MPVATSANTAEASAQTTDESGPAAEAGTEAVTTATVAASTSIPVAATDADLVWVGVGEAYRFDNGGWTRAPHLDYEFEVHQVRSGQKWDSTVNLHRTVADYDGSAGDREQVTRFAYDFESPVANESIDYVITSNLGNGVGITDREFREMSFTLSLDAPTPLFNTFRITHRFVYEDGSLTGTVDLFLVDADGVEHPAFQMRETAKLFAATTFAEPPTVAQ